MNNLKKIVFLIFIFIVQISVNADKNVYHNLPYGIKITKPNDWVFEKIDNILKFREGYVFKDKQKEEELSKIEANKLAIITKYKEPFKGINPTLQITIKSLENVRNYDGLCIMNTYASTAGKYFDNFIIKQKVKRIKIDKYKGYQVKYEYSMTTTSGKRENLFGSMTLFSNKNFAFIIQTTCAQSGKDKTDKEFDEIMKSIKFE